MRIKKILITGVAVLGLISTLGFSTTHADMGRTPSQQIGHDSWIEGQDDSANDNGQISRSERNYEDSSINADRQAQENKLHTSRQSAKSNGESSKNQSTNTSTSPLKKSNKSHKKLIRESKPNKDTKINKHHSHHFGLIAGIVIVVLIVVGILIKVFTISRHQH